MYINEAGATFQLKSIQQNILLTGYSALLAAVNIHANTLLRHHFVEHRKETQLETS